MSDPKVQRNSAVELLRIVAMLFIVCSHCSVHSDLPSANSNLFFNNILLDWCVLGNLGVDIFMLISGYFLCDNLHYNRTRSTIRLLTQVWFYSVLGLVIYLITGHQFTWTILIKSVFPTVFSQYWFFTTYFVLIFFFPYINILLNKLSKTQLRSLITAMMVFWSIIPTFTNQKMGGGVLCQFIMLYSIGAYFKKNPDTMFQNKKNRYLLTAVSGLLMFTSSVILRIIFGKYTQYFYSRHSILTLGLAIGLFTIAIYKGSFHNKYINKIAGCTFGVYLFHDHPLMREIIWYEWLPKIKFYNSYILIASIILSILIVMSVGTIIELIRRATVQKLLENMCSIAVMKTKNFLKTVRRDITN